MRSQIVPESSIQLAPNQLLGPLQSFRIEVARRSSRFLPVPLEESHFQQQKFHRARITLSRSVYQLRDYHLSLAELFHPAVLSNFDRGIELVPDDRGKAF